MSHQPRTAEAQAGDNHMHAVKNIQTSATVTPRGFVGPQDVSRERAIQTYYMS